MMLTFNEEIVDTSVCSRCDQREEDTLVTVWRGVTQVWCNECWGSNGGWVCEECARELPLEAFNGFGSDVCSDCTLIPD